MRITIFSFVVTAIYSSAIILLLYLLRTKARLVSICSASNVTLLYLFCAIRLFLPVEFVFTKPVEMPVIINPIYKVLTYNISLHGVGRIKVYNLLAGIILLVGLIKLIILVREYLKVFTTVKKFSKIKENAAIDAFDKGKNIEIRECEIIGSPISFGILKKMILLPAKNYEKETEKLILLHEYGHHANKDLLVKILVEVFSAIYWWNPIVYLLSKDLYQTFELRCDQTVVESLDSEGRIKYLQVLLDEYKNNSSFESAFSIGLSNSKPTAIEERFEEIRYYNAGKKKYGNCLVPIFFVITFFLSYLVVFRSKYDAPQGQMNTHYGEEFSKENSYIIEYENKYYIQINQDLIKIDDEYVEKLLNDGFELKKGF
ncbi:MAG: M56 family metallopeptidase [Pseudobutyrivibrio sp.]|nr:M56 family metallopeptidase [Pseudobutyrivibrio sp.]